MRRRRTLPRANSANVSSGPSLSSVPLSVKLSIPVHPSTNGKNNACKNNAYKNSAAEETGTA